MRQACYFTRILLGVFVVTVFALSGCQTKPPLITPSKTQNPSLFPFGSTFSQHLASKHSPIRLTASDGTGLRLIGMIGRAVVEEPLAFTELHLTFQNPQDRTLEGTFTITLPQGATVSRFAMKLDQRWQEGEVVEKQEARKAYEDFLHRKQDPALLEQGAGNEFSARVFPIPAKGVKDLIISYSQSLTSGETYALSLRGLPQIGHLDLAVTRSGDSAPVLTLDQTNVAPDRDFVLDPKHLRQSDGLRSGPYVLAKVRPMADSLPDPIPSAIILVDTSASRALDFDEQLALLQKLVQQLIQISGPQLPLSVAAYDQATDTIYEGDASGFGKDAIQRLVQRQALGATDLSQALSWIANQAQQKNYKRLFLISDGVPTAGELSSDTLAKTALHLKQSGIERLDAIALGGIRDDSLLQALVRAGLPHDGVVVPNTANTATLTRRISQATRSGITVSVEGAGFTWPQKLDGIQPGDDALVYASVAPDMPVKITLDGKTITPTLRPVDRPLLERAWVQAKIESLSDAENIDSKPDAIRNQIIDLSIAHRVLSPHTALLVLETEQDYVRFGIDRKGLSDIITINEGKIALLHRTWSFGKGQVRPPMPPQPAPADQPNDPSQIQIEPLDVQGNLSTRGNMWGDSIGDSFGAGGLGLSGIGEGGGGRSEGIGLGNVGTIGHGAGTGQGQGFGAGHGRLSAEPLLPSSSQAQGFSSGHGRLGGSHRTRPPSIRMGQTQVSGRLPPEVIQRIVRQNFGKFRLCYEQGLRASPNLQNRISVRFVIDPAGNVSSATDAGSDLPDQSVIACVVRAFKDLKFPSPEGGSVTVIYPIHFAPGDMTSGGSAPQSPDTENPSTANPYTGRFKTVMDTIAKGTFKEAVQTAYAWHIESPSDIMALVALGEALEAYGDVANASRAYGSILDLFSFRADMRRFTGERLERLPANVGLALALDSYQKAAEQRPDHPASHRLLAFAYVKQGQHEKAFDALVTGLSQNYPSGRFAGVGRILEEDLGLVAAAWIKAQPDKKASIMAKLKSLGGRIESQPSLRFIINWETDANDVDFHIYDAQGGHAYYSQPSLPSGGELYADVTTGYGPECFTIRASKQKRSAFYTLQAHYYSRGPMGYGMGKLQVIDHDGKGTLSFVERPFVVMTDQAYVDLGTVKR